MTDLFFFVKNRFSSVKIPDLSRKSKKKLNFYFQFTMVAPSVSKFCIIRYCFWRPRSGFCPVIPIWIFGLFLLFRYKHKNYGSFFVSIGWLGVSTIILGFWVVSENSVRQPIFCFDWLVFHFKHFFIILSWANKLRRVGWPWPSYKVLARFHLKRFFFVTFQCLAVDFFFRFVPEFFSFFAFRLVLFCFSNPTWNLFMQWWNRVSSWGFLVKITQPKLS
jgi:hypothetical protein